VGASNNVILRLCDAVDQPSANTCANLCPAHLKSERVFSRFCWSLPKMDSQTTLVEKKRKNSCVLKHPLCWGSSATKKSANKPRKYSLRTRYYSDVFKISRLAPQKKKNPRFAQFYSIRSSSSNSLNSGPKILRSCLLHWYSYEYVCMKHRYVLLIMLCIYFMYVCKFIYHTSICNKWLSGFCHLYIVTASHELTSGHVMLEYS